MNDTRRRRVAFGDEATLTAFNQLKEGKFEERQLAEFIQRAIYDLKENPLTGVIVPRRLWPREYKKKYDIDNLRKYDLPNGWRLTYTLRGSSIEILAVILEWFNHKEYEKRFGYHVK